MLPGGIVLVVKVIVYTGFIVFECCNVDKTENPQWYHVV